MKRKNPYTRNRDLRSKRGSSEANHRQARVWFEIGDPDWMKPGTGPAGYRQKGSYQAGAQKGIGTRTCLTGRR